MNVKAQRTGENCRRVPLPHMTQPEANWSLNLSAQAQPYKTRKDSVHYTKKKNK